MAESTYVVGETMRCRGATGKWCYCKLVEPQARTVQWTPGFARFPVPAGSKVYEGTASKFERLTGSSFRNALKSCFVWDGSGWVHFGKYIGHETKGERIRAAAKQQEAKKRAAESTGVLRSPGKKRKASEGVAAATALMLDESEDSDDELPAPGRLDFKGGARAVAAEIEAERRGFPFGVPTLGVEGAVGSFLEERETGDEDAKAARVAVNALADAAWRAEHGGADEQRHGQEATGPPPPPKAPVEVVGAVASWADALARLGLMKPDSTVDMEKLSELALAPQRARSYKASLASLGLLDADDNVDVEKHLQLQRHGATRDDVIPWTVDIARQAVPQVAPPPQWPAGLAFISGCSMARIKGRLPTPEEIAAFYQRNASECVPSPFVRICFDGAKSGAVAKTDIAAGKTVIDVVGILRNKYPVDARLDSAHIYRVNSTTWLDARHCGNESRFVERAAPSDADQGVLAPRVALNLDLSIVHRSDDTTTATLQLRATRKIIAGERLVWSNGASTPSTVSGGSSIAEEKPPRTIRCPNKLSL